MSALKDIRAYLKQLQPPEPNYERVIFVGWSAYRSIATDIAFRDAPQDANEQIEGIPVQRTTDEEVKGWVVREIGPSGVWRDAKPLEPVK